MKPWNHIPLIPLINIPETFGRAMSYEGQFHALCKRICEITEAFNTALEYINDNFPWKFADPIEWDATHDYDAYTVVYDPVTFSSYVSLQPVPAGTPLTDTDYWAKTADYNAALEALRDTIAGIADEVEAAAKSASDAAESAESAAAVAEKVEGFDARITQVENTVNSFSASVAGLLQRVSDLERVTEGQASTITNHTVTINEHTASIDDLKAKDTNLQAQIDDIKPKAYGGRPYFYVNGTTGSDDAADATKAATPWKTLDKAMTWPIEHGYVDFGIRITGAGTYECTDLQISNVSIHLIAWANNVTVNFPNRLNSYNAYLHFEHAGPNGTSSGRTGYMTVVLNDGLHMDSADLYTLYVEFKSSTLKSRSFDLAGTPGLLRYTKFTNQHLYLRNANFAVDHDEFSGSIVEAEHADVHAISTTVAPLTTATFWKQSGCDLFVSGSLTVNGMNSEVSGYYLFDLSGVDAKFMLDTIAGTNTGKWQYAVNLNGTESMMRSGFFEAIEKLSSNWFPVNFRESRIVTQGTVRDGSTGDKIATAYEGVTISELNYECTSLDHVTFSARLSLATQVAAGTTANLLLFKEKFRPTVRQFIPCGMTAANRYTAAIAPSGTMYFTPIGSAFAAEQIVYIYGTFTLA